MPLLQGFMNWKKTISWFWSIFFTINSYKIAPAEDAKIREVVDYLNKNTEAKVLVTGYADKGTGNDVINDRIAAKRAAAVVGC